METHTMTANATRTFPAADVLELASGEPGDHHGFEDGDGYMLCIKPRIVGRSRWSYTEELVFSHHGGFYRATYQLPATELQDGMDAPRTLECVEVYPVTVEAVQFLTDQEADVIEEFTGQELRSATYP
jgi:hypothetical protein